MSQAYLIPDGLKPSECERGSIKEVPLPFIPRPEPETRSEATTVKVKISKTLEERVKTFDGTTQESYVQLMEDFAGLLRKKGLKQKCKGYEKLLTTTKEDLSLLEAVAPSKDEEDLAASDSEDEAEASKKKKKSVAKKMTKKEKHALKVNTLEKKKKLQEEQIQTFQDEAFDLFECLLGENARDRWNSITVKVCESKEWQAEDGTIISTKRGSTWDSLRLCQRDMLLTVFSKDAAEAQRNYMNFKLKKPQRMKIRQFALRLQYMSRCIKYLPTLKDTPVATKEMERMNKPFTHFELCGIILRCCKQEWSDRYYLTNEVVPTDVEQLLPKLEAIEQLENTKKRASVARGDKPPPPRNKRTSREKAGRTGALAAEASIAPGARNMAVPTRPTTPSTVADLMQTAAPSPGVKIIRDHPASSKECNNLPSTALS